MKYTIKKQECKPETATEQTIELSLKMGPSGHPTLYAENTTTGKLDSLVIFQDDGMTWFFPNDAEDLGLKSCVEDWSSNFE